MLARFSVRLVFISIVLTMGANSFGQFYNGSYQDFGKNRVQYREFLWSFYKFKNVDVYFYTGGKNLAIFAANTADQIIEQTEDFFDYSLEGKLQLIVYNKLADLKQSNIGFVSEEDYNVGGVTRIVGSKIFLYFNGDHNHLVQQLREGIAEVLISQMMYGGSWKDRVKNSTLLSLPDWYLEGLISYYAMGWDQTIENRVKDGILSNRYKRFNHLRGIDAKYAGHSIWNFIVERYGESLIPSILYMTKVSRNIESGFIFVLGSSLRELTDDWLEFYRNKFYGYENIAGLPLDNSILKRTKKSRIYSQLRISPDGKHVAYTTNQLGKYKVYILDIETGKTKKVFKGGYKLDRLVDYSYPLIDWHPTKPLLSIIVEKQEEIHLNYYFLETEETQRRTLHHFQKILDFSYSDDGKQFVMSAILDAQTDIYVYHLGKNTSENITDDIFDDHNPRFINNSQDIVFTSNRINDTIAVSQKAGSSEALTIAKNNDVFLYNYSGKAKVLKRITNSPEYNESFPVEFDKNVVSYLSDKNGINNRMLTKFDSIISHVDTVAHYRFITEQFPASNYKRSIIEQDANSKSQKYAEIIYNKGRYHLLMDDLSVEDLINAGSDLRENERENRLQPEEEQIDPNEPGNEDLDDQGMAAPGTNEEDGRINIYDYVFEIEKVIEEKEKEKLQVTDVPVDFPDNILEDPSEEETETGEEDKEETSGTKVPTNEYVRTIEKLQIPSKQWNYNNAFFTEYFVSQLDNRYLNETYQKFTGGGAVYTNPGLNLFFKIGVSDLFEDQRIVGGMRLSGNLNNNEFFVSYENLKKRLDKQVVFHRQSYLAFQTNGTGVKVHTHDLKNTFTWPFTEIMAVKGSVILRNDRSVILSTDVSSLTQPTTFESWAGLKGEFVFDNTATLGLNLYKGTRYKVFAEWYRQLDDSQTDLFVLGLDFRKYIRIHRDLIWASRIAASTSLGDKRVVYYLGGVDGWLKPEFNSDDIPQDPQYAYQSVATNMRGFQQNIRNGNSFALASSEIRFPIFKYFMNRPMKSDFIKNFQIVSFADVGAAWTGDNPYATDNSFNTKTILKGPITVRLIHQREPIVAGYGLGVRSRVFGYFVRLDWAKGIEDGIHLPHIWYWSLSLDF